MVQPANVINDFNQRQNFFTCNWCIVSEPIMQGAQQAKELMIKPLIFCNQQFPHTKIMGLNYSTILVRRLNSIKFFSCLICVYVADQKNHMGNYKKSSTAPTGGYQNFRWPLLAGCALIFVSRVVIRSVYLKLQESQFVSVANEISAYYLNVKQINDKETKP